MGRSRSILLIMGFAVLSAQSATAQTKQECLDRMTELVNQGFITDVKSQYGVPIFAVDESLWRGMPFRLKENLAELVKCSFQNSDQAWYDAEFRSNMTNKLLAKLRWGKLGETE